jgi:hypothetical protein
MKFAYFLHMLLALCKIRLLLRIIFLMMDGSQFQHNAPVKSLLVWLALLKLFRMLRSYVNPFTVSCNIVPLNL